MENQKENKQEIKAQNFGEFFDFIDQNLVSDDNSYFSELPVSLEETSIKAIEDNQDAV